LRTRLNLDGNGANYAWKTSYWNGCEYFAVQVLHKYEPSTIGDKVKLVEKV